MKIKINDIESYRSPESCNVNFDDRVEKIPLIQGNAVQDYGHVASGDTITVSALFSWDNATAIASLWESRTLVNFTDESGAIWQNVRLVLRSYKYFPRFKDYVLLDFEVWRV